MGWLGVIQYAHTVHITSNWEHHRAVDGRCKGWTHCYAEAQRCLGANPASLADLDNVFQSQTGCASCQAMLDLWRSKVEAKIALLPKFSVYL